MLRACLFPTTSRSVDMEENQPSRLEMFVAGLAYILMCGTAYSLAWCKKMFSSTIPVAETTSKVHLTYPNTQRREITKWDIALVAGFSLFVFLLFFLLESVTCFHRSDACLLGSAELGEMVLNWIK